MTHEEMEKLIAPRMKEKRYRHSLAVAKQAKNLARLYGEDPEKAYTAGMLHDILKEETPEEQLNLIEGSDIIFDWSQYASPKIYHGFAAAVYLKKEHIVEDEEILSSIMYHTTGKRTMTRLEKIVFTADFTSEDRSFPEAKKARKLAQKDLDKAVLYIARVTVESLLERESVVCTDTVELYNQMRIEADEKKGESER